MLWWKTRYFVVAVLCCEPRDKIPNCLHLGKISLQLKTLFFHFSPPFPPFSKLSVLASVFCEEGISVWQQHQR